MKKRKPFQVQFSQRNRSWEEGDVFVYRDSQSNAKPPFSPSMTYLDVRFPARRPQGPIIPAEAAASLCDGTVRSRHAAPVATGKETWYDYFFRYNRFNANRRRQVYPSRLKFPERIQERINEPGVLQGPKAAVHTRLRYNVKNLDAAVVRIRFGCVEST